MMQAEVAMLRANGHKVELIEADNREIEGLPAKISAAFSTFYSHTSRHRMKEALRRYKPDVLHIHNWFPLLSPSIIAPAAEAGVAVVQTLHNFRMVCAGATLFRNGNVCHDCVGKALPLGSVLHGCYSSSRVGSAVVSGSFAFHRVANTWKDVGTFIALTEFHRRLLVAGGVDSKKVIVKPNFVRNRGSVGDGAGGYAVFVGRLAAEKGILTALDAWGSGKMSIPLRIYGDGPLADEVRERCKSNPGIEYFGHRSSDEVDKAMCGARFLVFPSLAYEPFAVTIIEAFSRGTPVLAANLDSITNLVREGETGLCFRPGDIDDLARKAELLLADDERYGEMRSACRRLYEESYTEEKNYALLMGVYERSLRCRSANLGAKNAFAEGRV